MNNILFINACVRPESRTKLLAERVLRRLDGDITELELQKEDIRPLDNELLTKRLGLQEKGEYEDPMFRYAAQFADADEIVIAAPYWDLSFPSLLKVYIEHICVVGKTFAYREDGTPYGMCRAKRIIYVTTAGGPVLPGLDLGFDYVKGLADTFFGIPEVLRIGIDGIDMVSPGETEAMIEKVLSDIEKDERL